MLLNLLLQQQPHIEHFLFLKFLIGGKLLCNVVSVFAVQHELAIIMHTEPPSPPCVPPLGHQIARLGSLCYRQIPDEHFSPVIYFTHGHLNILMLLSPFAPLSPSLTVPTTPFSTSVSLLTCVQVPTMPFFHVPYICV